MGGHNPLNRSAYLLNARNDPLLQMRCRFSELRPLLFNTISAISHNAIDFKHESIARAHKRYSISKVVKEMYKSHLMLQEGHRHEFLAMLAVCKPIKLIDLPNRNDSLHLRGGSWREAFGRVSTFCCGHVQLQSSHLSISFVPPWPLRASHKTPMHPQLQQSYGR
jgi:hypothetical protein